jgi:general secretion pathway protein H
VNHSHRRSLRGVTLLEVLIVVALIALLTAGVLSGTGVIGGARLRGAATLVLTGIRTGITHANTTGLPSRLVFDLDEQWIMLEETSGRMLRRSNDDEDADDPSVGAAPQTDIEREAVGEATRILEGPHEPPPQFSTVTDFGTGDEPGKGRPLGQGVSFISVQTEHDPLPREEGRAYLYFWPGGGTERAVIRLKREGQEDGLSIVVSALTGKAQIVRGEVQLDEPLEGVDTGEREAD